MSNFFVKNNKKGFTLIELLVVIAIIGLLATLSIVALNSARMKGRDAKRKADLKQIYNALQMYYDENGKYPPVGGQYIFSTSGKNWFAALSPWMSTQPIDPINNAAYPWGNNNYSYCYGNVTTDGQSFDLVGQLENTSDPDRCELKQYKFKGSVAAGNSWCGNYNYSKYLYSPQ